MSKELFRETQRNIYLIVAVSFITAFFGVLGGIQIISGKPLGNHPISNGGFIALFLASLLFLAFMNSQKLKVVITENEIRVSFGLLTGETVIRVDDIKRISLRKYSGLKEFKGWGVRYNDNESCFTVSGDNALEIELVNNQKILVGTQMPEKLQAAIGVFAAYQ